MAQFGLIGKSLSHSFSQKFFTQKFDALSLLAKYTLFEIETIDLCEKIFKETATLRGLNVTIPYKSAIIPYLDDVSPEAKAIGAVNTILVTDNKKTKGYNTDVYGFEHSLSTFFPYSKDTKLPTKALILGTGGAAKAVQFVLRKWQFQAVILVSRTPQDEKSISYQSLMETDLKDFSLIIQTSPIGMYPNIDACPIFPFEQLSNSHYIMDLVYNPESTLFLQKAKKLGANVKNGLEMLYLQAEKAWEIWNDEHELKRISNGE